ncbi:MAG TPA: hypothetical protein VEK38_00900 [Candidatus Bathyarchaeia archaeon]|nr:hypothetical protein [Candidatus Bathyarchaeia archaeon]
MNHCKLALVGLWVPFLYGALDTITVYNNTADSFFIAFYETDQTTAKWTEKPQLVGGHASVMFGRPEKRIAYDQFVCCDMQEKMLPATLSKADMQKGVAKHADRAEGSSFYVVRDDRGNVHVYNKVEYDLFMLHGSVDTALRAEKSALLKTGSRVSVSRRAESTVAKNLAISAGEQQYLRKRQRNVAFSIKNFLSGFDIGQNPPPKIAFIAGGGGAASIFAMLGGLSGMLSSGLMDIVAYIATASGATWPLGTWMTTQKSFVEFKSGFIKKMQKLFVDILPSEKSLMASALSLKVGAGEPMSSGDLLGVCVANRLFEEFSYKRQMMTLTLQQKRLADGLNPFPLYMAMQTPLQGVSDSVYVEFNPFDVGSLMLGTYIPAAAYNSLFKGGKTTTTMPEENFGTILATCGSASVTPAFIAPVWKIIAPACSQLVRSTVDAHVIQGTQSVVHTYVSNFTAGIQNNRFAQEKVLSLQDAGILPYQIIDGRRPGRAVDLYIILDSSGDWAGSLLQNMQAHAQRVGLSLPVIESGMIGSGTAIIYKDEDNLKTPVIVYISAPFVVQRQDLDSGLAYRTREDKIVPLTLKDILGQNKAAGLVDDFEKQLTDSIPLIKDALLWIISNKKVSSWTN